MFRHLFKTNKIFRNSTLIIGGLASDIGINNLTDYLYQNSKLYDAKFDKILHKLYIKDDIETFKDNILFNIKIFTELPVSAAIEELLCRDAIMRYLLMTRAGLGPIISNFMQAVPFSLFHESIKPNDISDYANKNLNQDDIKSIADNVNDKYNNYNYFYYGSLYASGLIFGGLTLLSKTIWIPSVVHTIHNQIWYYNTRKEYLEKENNDSDSQK